MSTSKIRMPAPYGQNHPTYDPEEPSSATRFFDEVEMAATEAGITDEPATVIRWALSYLPEAIKKHWAQLTMDGATQRTYAQWRAEVMKILPRRVQEEAGSLVRLDALVTKWARDPISRHDRADFYDFTLGFVAEARAVNALISNRELVRMYLRCLTSAFRERLQEKLTPGTNRSAEAPYEWEAVVATAQSLVAGGTTGPFRDLSLEPSTREYSRIKLESGGNSGGSKALETIRVKQEEMESNFQSMLSKLDVMGIQMKDLVHQREVHVASKSDATVFQQMVTPQRPPYSNPTQHPRQGLYTRPATNPFNTPPRICYYCQVEGHMLMACPTLESDKASGRVVQRGYNIYMNNRQLSRDSPDGLSMKQHADAILAGTYNPPAAVNMLTAEDWGVAEEANMILFQSEPEMVTHSVLQQSMDRLRNETQSAMQSMASHIISSLKPVSTPAPPPAPFNPSPYVAPQPSTSQSVPASEVRDMFQLLTKRLDGLEQFQIQTRSGNAPSGEGFR
ncbi:hypothetical protein D9611_007601 [Ephemerocybe angulata]|uniref:CCHC-type domain-containing protein n=1 Tax=Ephemerocybe angulata TaxID=980116 RepID=A0A8H5FCI4_9AGAR|nr:hypothetical protein D9611_007601 [Tulosesus angulatus]